MAGESTRRREAAELKEGARKALCGAARATAHAVVAPTAPPPAASAVVTARRRTMQIEGGRYQSSEPGSA